MFNLESSIAQWRREMLAAGISTPTPLEELELHLREGIDTSQASGLGEADAFYSAVQKIGSPPAIQNDRIRDAIFVPVMLWLVILACVIMPHTALPPGQKSVASLWGLAPFGIILGWCWGFAAAARKKFTSAAV